MPGLRPVRQREFRFHHQQARRPRRFGWNPALEDVSPDSRRPREDEVARTGAAKQNQGRARMSRSSEIDVMRIISEEFEKLEDAAARNRVLRWATEAYWTGGSLFPTSHPSKSGMASPELTSVGDLLESARPEGTQD